MRKESAMTATVRRAVVAVAGIGLAGCALLMLAGCDRQTPAASSPDATGTTPAPVVRVDTVLAAREGRRRISEAVPAELMPYEKTDLYAKVSGFLKEIRVDYGDRVKKGELLATLWVPELEKEFEQKKALAMRAEADVRFAQEAIHAAEAEFRWRKSLHERLTRVGRNGVIDSEAVAEAQYQFESSKAKWDMARADVDVKKATVQVAQAERDQVAAMLEYTRIVAPYDGVITRRYLHTGAFLNPKSGEQPLLVIVRTDRLRVIVDVPEKEVRYLSKDARVVVDLDALPGKKFEWTITRLAPVLGAGKKVRVEVDILNRDGTLYPGMYGHAAVILEEKPGTLTLPASCLRHDDQGPFVWLVVDGKVKRQRVTVRRSDGAPTADSAEITAGLNGTEEVVWRATDTLHEGQAVLAQRTAARAKSSR